MKTRDEYQFFIHLRNSAPKLFGPILLSASVFLSSALDVRAQTTLDVCRETQKVLRQYENEEKEQRLLVDFKKYENKYRDSRARVQQAVTSGSLLNTYLLGEYAALVALPFPNGKKSEQLTIEERRAFQIELLEELSTAIDLVAGQEFADIKGQYDLIKQQLDQRAARFRALNCEAVLGRGDRPSDGWTGTWARSDGVETLSLTGSGGALSGSFEYSGAGFSGSGSWSNCKVDGNTAMCDWTASHDDNTKSGTRHCKATATLAGNTLSVTLVESEPTWSWKPGYGPFNVSSVMHKDAVWNLTYTRK